MQWERLQSQIGKFVDEYVLTEFDIERTWQEQLEQKLQQKENQRTSRSAGNDDETNAISSPAQQPYSSGMSMYRVLSYVSENNNYNYLSVLKNNTAHLKICFTGLLSKVNAFDVGNHMISNTIWNFGIYLE